MNTLSLHPVYQPKDPVRRYKGIAIVVALHLVIGWAIVSGTARNALVAIKKPLQAVVIQDVVIPPPPPPKKVTPPQAPKVEAPPPPFVPPPDTPAPVPSTAPQIAAVATPPPRPVEIAPPPPPPAPPAPAKVAPDRTDLRIACPTQVPPQWPRKAIQEGTEGTVKASALIKGGVIQEITILSGPRIFHAAVKAAMLQYKCAADAGEITATQDFVFKLE